MEELLDRLERLWGQRGPARLGVELDGHWHPIGTLDWPALLALLQEGEER